VIISVGRLDIAKNFPLLIAAFDRVRAALDSRLVIIGEGSQRPLLEQRIQSSPYARDIALLGQQTNPFAYLKRAAIFALSSSWEGFGNVLVEAMATGTPVVATDCPNGPREILDSGRLGQLVPMDDSEALARAIIDTLRSPIAAETLRQATIPYHADAVAQHYLQTFKLDAASPAPDPA
jgi:glycosyltransferase involved in cell wall biosynthesis